MAESDIQKFYKGCNVFITGGTGFMGKILLEKLLRSTDVATIYILVREKKGKNMHTRIDELLDDVIFNRLKTECPKFKHKIEGVAGDCSFTGLGLTITDRQKLISSINIVFNVAATVRFDENIKLAYNINVNGVRDVIELSKQMKNLKSVVHVSTAYSNCYLKEIEEKFYDCVDYEELGNVLEKLSQNEAEELTPRLIGKWPNTYTFTKALAETLIKKNGHGLPIGIYRPAIVISTYKEPVEGWIDNLYGPTGLCAGAMSGLLRVNFANIDNIADMVPVDTCVAGLIAASWEVGTKHGRSTGNIPIYNYVSSPENPITWKDFITLNLNHGMAYPLKKALWPVNYTATQNTTTYMFMKMFYHIIPAIIFDFGILCCGKAPRLLKMYQRIHKFSDVLSFFSMNEWKFNNDNVIQLWKGMSEQDKNIFPFSMKTVHWLSYFRIYVKGIRNFLLHDSDASLTEARIRYNRLTVVDTGLKLLLKFVISILVWSVFSKIFSLITS